MSEKHPAAVTLGRLGGLAGKGKSSPRKAATSRANGRKGGRPPNTPGSLTEAVATLESAIHSLLRKADRFEGRDADISLVESTSLLRSRINLILRDERRSDQ